MFRRSLVVALLVMAGLAGRAQGPLYEPGSVHEVRLTFTELDWRQRLESLFLLGNDDRLLGDLLIDGASYLDVGVRFKGYSSYAAGRMKNPFNIKLDEVHNGQEHQGFDKLKLSNVIQDPSFLREVLGYEVARNYMPASGASYANLFVNDTLIGLYTNVEDVGKEFMEAHFGSRDGAFFKGNPPTVDINGANCDLSDAPGSDSAAYMTLYDIQSDAGWGHLLELISVLNTDPANIAAVLNVDRTLWMHAFNYAIINFDSYVGYAQNYYLYRDADGRWNPIIWDLNMSFASFRLTDASTYWNGFSVAQAATIDPLAHHNSVSVFPRPLMRNLFANAMYRRMYLAHLRTIIQEQFASNVYYDRALTIRNTIDPYVQADTNKFYTYEAFLANLDAPVSFTVEYPGIASLMQARASYLSGYPGMSGEPTVGTPQHEPASVVVGDELTITISLSGVDTAFLAYRFGDVGLFNTTALYDDGLHGDGSADDGVFGARFVPEASLVEYYVYAENGIAGAFSPTGAAYRTYRIGSRPSPGQLVINEFMASNNGAVLDPDGGSSDWVELYNTTSEALSTAGMYLSDDPQDPTKWALPLRTIAPHDYLVLWLDGRTGAGDDHASFQLDAEGESLLLAYDDTTVLDRIDFGPQYPIYTTGRIPNGSGSFRLLPPTLNDANALGIKDQPDRLIQIYPNPATTDLYLIIQLEEPFSIEILRSDGRVITAPTTYLTRNLIRLDPRTIGSGHYVLRVNTATSTTTRSFILLP
ncbi:MAG: CotH kinase family protein [Flavobacteriales bacterium]|jgi:hypothetical protein|nr:CotH kinase family protein [Flavobacteriales bacterium]MBK6551161.1 CotH kinase family protein [Flavobacteriales bacterium]MBK6883693.1 CotH kinase family protein [Flavobacteriales bacterium]MBK7101051.1 CotH kinase family protein [Flavobacteriales bacterium]MBK7111767.1 CotH kinase family protein [Flavobacteriales bacterium]